MKNVIIDVTALEPRMKHPAIFNAFDQIGQGLSVVIHNDHDPKPLYYQLLGERGNCFTWTYIQNGPEIWEVEIKKNIDQAETIGEIAAKDMRKAELFKNLGIDFCCGGKRTLEEACQENGLDVLGVSQQLEETEKQALEGTTLDFNKMNLGFLTDYIINVHHAYVYENAPMIEDLAHKVAGHHGENMPFLIAVYQKITELNQELIAHLKKEEQLLFPAIKIIETGGKPPLASIQYPIQMMEKDHDLVGKQIKEIRSLTSGYAAPEGACNSIKMLYFKLEAFESDLLQHIHLENNILFPKVTAMEA